MIALDIAQRTDEWFAERAKRPTASNFHRLLTATGRDSSQWEGYAIEMCCARLRPDEVQWEGNFHTDRGEALEPEARELFARVHGVEVKEVGLIVRDDGGAGCSPDGLVVGKGGIFVESLGVEVNAGLEIKCPLAKNHARYLLDGGLPDAYKAQVHGSMAVTGLDYWYFMSYCPGLAPFFLRVERDAYTDKLSDTINRFVIYYADVLNRVMPVLRGERAV